MGNGTVVKYRVRSVHIRPLYVLKSEPVPDTSVSSVRHQYRRRILRTFGVTSIPVPDTWVTSARHLYRYRVLRYLLYDMDTGTVGTRSDFHTGAGHFGEFGTTSIPTPDTSGYGYRYRRYRYRFPYRYRTLRQVRYNINTGTGHFGKFGTTVIAVPGVPVPYGTRPWNLVCNALYQTSTPKTMLWIGRGADDVKARPSLCTGIDFIELMYLPVLMHNQGRF